MCSEKNLKCNEANEQQHVKTLSESPRPRSFRMPPGPALRSQ